MRDKAAPEKQRVGLTAAEEQELARLWRDHKDKQALDKLIVSYKPLARKHAARYRNIAPFDDLMQEAMTGVVIAAQRFDPERKLRFYTYAMYWVQAYLVEYIVRNNGPIRIGTNRAQRKVLYGISKARQKLENEKGEATIKDLASELGVDEETVELVLSRMGRDVSFSAENEGSGIAIERYLGEDPKQEDGFLAEEASLARSKAIKRALSCLDPRERRVVYQRYLATPTKTLLELSELLDLSRERVRQIEFKAFRKIKEYLGETEGKELSKAA